MIIFTLYILHYSALTAEKPGGGGNLDIKETKVILTMLPIFCDLKVAGEKQCDENRIKLSCANCQQCDRATLKGVHSPSNQCDLEACD